MNYEHILVDSDGPVMTVRFNRPEKRNAISIAMHYEIQDLCHRLTDDTDTRVVIFKGDGAGFSAGADTSEFSDPQSVDELAVRHRSGIGSRTSAAIEYLPQVTIASVHGFAIGGALVFTACCDMRFAGDKTWFSIPEVDLGLPLGWNALPRLAREIGHAKAFELTVTCERFDAKAAHDYGLVTHVTPEAEVHEKARAMAGKIAAQPPLPVALTKATMRALKRGSEMGEAAHADTDMLLYARLMSQRRRRLEKEGRA